MAHARKGLAGQWFQTLVMTDQREHPWLSKGFLSYYDRFLLEQLSPATLEELPYSNHHLWLRVAKMKIPTQSINKPLPYSVRTTTPLIPATKAGLWLSLLRDSIGFRAFDQNMINYLLNAGNTGIRHRRILKISWSGIPEKISGPFVDN